MKKPGPAKRAQSGQSGAEHRIRTGDLRLGKALTRMCTEMQRESSRWNLRRSRSPRARRSCKPMQPESTALLTPRSAVPGSVVSTIPDDRLLTIAEVTELRKVTKSIVYSACDR